MKKEAKWAATLSALLFALFTLFTFLFSNGCYYFNGCITNTINRYLPDNSIWCQVGSRFAFVLAAIFIIALTVMLFMKKRKVLTLIFTAALALISAVNFLIIVGSDLKFYIYCLGMIFSPAPWERMYVIDLASVFFFVLLFAVFTVIVLLNCIPALRSKTAWTRYVGFLPGALLAVAEIIFGIAMFICKHFQLYQELTVFGLLSTLFYLALDLIFAFAIVFMGIWITSGERNTVTAPAEQAEEPEPVAVPEPVVEPETVAVKKSKRDRRRRQRP